MNAKEARAATMAVVGKNDDNQYSSIQSLISNAVKNETFYICVDGRIRPNVRDKLLKEGFTIGDTRQSGMNEECTEIFWGRED